ncbi:LysR family transcriptional regulator [Marivita sp. GX14005]|uniref:LysR family transcriptional regulator n=1 Tax=Marivita sp. GX14005 TaxID=2942276 RepID=UPI0020187F1B|nr:LysR family transcriptional regulator [Marivita sp. GX14005]MCL3883337.1 LysR family transcriptional regulator [Marivita sp. GX14005]
MSLSQMRSFAAVYLHGSTVRAAQILGRSQSQVSADLRRLETGMNLTLFMRQGGRLLPTTNAEALYPKVLSVFAAYDDAMNLSRGGKAESLSIGATRSLSMTVVPQLVRALRKRDPLRPITVRFISYRELIEAVAEGQLDQAIVKLPVEDPRVHHLTLGSAPLVGVIRASDPLAELKSIGAADIGKRHIIRTGTTSPAWQAVLRAFAAQGMAPVSEVSMDGVGPICRMVADGEGIGVVNRMLASGYAQDLGLVMRPFRPRERETFALIGHRLMTPRRDSVAVAETLGRLITLDVEETALA